MIIRGTYLKVIDNSGATLVQCIGGKFKVFNLGSQITVTLKKQKKVLSQKVFNSLILHTKFQFTRFGGLFLKNFENTVCLLNKSGLPFANRIKGYALIEFNDICFKVLSISKINI